MPSPRRPLSALAGRLRGLPTGRVPGRRRARVTAAAVTAALAAGVGLFGAGQATAEHTVPRSDREVPNLDQVKDRIAAYYGDTETSDGQHYASPHSPYAHQVRGITAGARHDLEKALSKKTPSKKDTHGSHGKHAQHGRPAIVVDVDDTTLLTYNFERRIDYAFDPKKQDDYLRSTDMKPVFGMKKLVNWADAHDVTVFYVTGRKEYQRQWSVRNLRNAGYTAPADKQHFYLKNEEHPPPYLECGADCTTIEYKSGTRRHIEAQGYDVLGSFGDQYSDLRGGYADRTYKLPNPMYYLP